jgi:hypothetical protein
MFEQPSDSFSPKNRPLLAFPGLERKQPDTPDDPVEEHEESILESSALGLRDCPETVERVAAGERIEPDRSNWGQGEYREEGETGISGINRFLGIEE